MTMQNLRNTKLPSAGVIAGAVQAIVYGGGATYGLYNSLFNVEGGHRAIVYNRVVGVKDKVRARARATPRAIRAPFPPDRPRAQHARTRARRSRLARRVLGVEPRVGSPSGPSRRSRGTALGQIVAIPFRR